MIRLSRLSIRRRTLLLGLLPAVLMFSLLISLFVWQRINDAKLEVAAVGDILSSQLAASIEYPVISGNFALLEPLVASAISAPSVVRVSISSPDGSIIYQRQVEAYEDLSSDHIATYIRSVTQEQEVFSEFSEFDDISMQPLIKTDIARVSVELSHILGRNRALVVVAKSVIWASLILFLCYLLARTMARSIAQPIERVSHALSNIAQGQLNTHVKVTDETEIGELQKGVNALAKALETAQMAQQRAISDLDSARQKAEEANKAKSEFLAIVSHELRTPINGAMGAVQLMAYQEDKVPDEYLNIADRSLNNLLELVEDMLTLGSLEKKEQSLDKQPTLIPNLLKHTLYDLEEKAQQNGNQLVIHFDSLVRQKSLSLDGIKFRQLLRHLLGNAVKFTRNGRIYCSIYLENTSKGLMLKLDISDNGIGFPEQQKTVMFEAFKQRDTSFTREFDGLGIGLTICNDIIQLMQGHLAIMDNNPRGTTVNCCIPTELLFDQLDLDSDAVKVISNLDGPKTEIKPAIVKSENAVKFEDESKGEHQKDKALSVINDDGAGAGAEDDTEIRVLIVEDNRVNRIVAEKILRNMKYSPVSVESGKACIERFQQEDFNVIFMDCHMPDMDGFETTQAIRQIEEQAQKRPVPIIALTANTSSDVRHDCIAAGMSDYVAKPIKIEVLHEVIKRWV